MADAQVARPPRSPSRPTYGRSRNLSRLDSPLSDFDSATQEETEPSSDRPEAGPSTRTAGTRPTYGRPHHDDGDNDDDDDNESAPAAPVRSKGRGLFADSSDDDQADATAVDPPGRPPNTDAVTRLRAMMGDTPRGLKASSQGSKGGHGTESTSSLSSAPPSQPQTAMPVSSSPPRLRPALQAPDSDTDSEDDFVPRGAVASRMRAKARGRPATTPKSLLSSDSNTASSSRTPPSSPSSSLRTLEAARKERSVAESRKQRLAELAAQKRGASPSLEDEFFGQLNDNAHAAPEAEGDDPIRSSSTADESDSELAAYRAAAKRAHDRAEPRRRKPSGSKAKTPKQPKGPKQLSKKELEEMHKMTAKIERSRPIVSLALQNHPVQRQHFDITSLAAKFRPELAANEASASDTATDDPAVSDPIETETPKTRSRADVALSSNIDDAGSPKGRNILYGDIESFPLRAQNKYNTLQMSQAASSPELPTKSAEQQQREARERALRLKKEKWLQAQAQKSEVRPLGVRNGPGQAADDDLQVIGKPPARKPAAAKGRTSEPTSSFYAALQERIRKQNIKARAGRTSFPQHQQGESASQASPADAGDDSIDALRKIQERVRAQGEAGAAGSETGSDDEGSDEDFVPDDVEAQDPDLQGSGSEPEDEGQDAVPHEEEEEEDLDKAPPSSQNTARSAPAFASQEEAGSDDGASDEDEDDPDQTFTASRKPRARRAVLDEEDEDSPSRSADAEDEVSSFSPPKRASDVSLSSGSSHVHPAGLTQFFGADEITNSASQRALPESQQPASQVDGLNLGVTPQESRSTQHPQRSGTGAFPTPSPSGDSVLGQFFADTQLSAPPRGESLDVIGATGRAINAENAIPFMRESSGEGSFAGSFAAGGLSRFFEEGTQVGTQRVSPPSLHPGSSDGGAISNPVASQLMPPPATMRTDGFAALRRAAQSDKELVLSPSSLPSNDDFDDTDDVGEYDAVRKTAAVGATSDAEATKTPRQYLNRDGFFTQTKPSLATQWASQTQTQSSADGRRESVDSLLDEARRPSSDRGSGSELAEAPRRRRFRRGAEPAEEDEESIRGEGGSEAEDAEASDVDVPNPAGSGSEAEDEGEGDEEPPRGSEDEDDEIHPGATRNAWDVLRKGAAGASREGGPGRPGAKDKKRQRDLRFIEGEAVESDEDEDGRPGGKRSGGGGLGGIFSDSGSDKDDGDEDDDESDDGRDLEELVDNEREIDEAAKDVLARERFQQDLEADDKAAMALADKAARGELRNKRRGRDGEGRLEDLLDDDFDEERLMRRANNPRAMMAKRRKIEGDEMDLLAAKQESVAFVKGYSETHQNEVGNEYSFLAPQDDDEEDEGDDDDDDDSGSQSGADDADEDDIGAAQQRNFTRRDLAREIREKRRQRELRRKQGLLSDEDEDDGADAAATRARPRKTQDPFASDDDADADGEDGERRRNGGRESLPSFLKDRLAARAASGSKRKRAGADSELHASAVADADGDMDADVDLDADLDPSMALLDRLHAQKTLLQKSAKAAAASGAGRDAARLARLAEEYKSEPDYTAGRGVFYASRGGGGGGGGGFGKAGAGAGAGTAMGGRTNSAMARSAVGLGNNPAAKGAGAGAAQGGDKAPARADSTGLGRMGILAARRVEESQ